MRRIPVFEPTLGPEEEASVRACLAAGTLSGGRDGPVERFEAAWAAACGRREGIAVTNGSAALELALDCLDLPPGSEVIVPAFTIVSCVNAIVRAGGRPVLVDSEPRTFAIDPARIEERITPRTRALLVVHLYGHPADMDPILEIAGRHGLALVEDAAEAHGAEYRSGRAAGAGSWRRCGSFGDLSTFSFYANKPITTGEGGMVLTDDLELARRLRSRRNLGFLPERRFLHRELGWNLRLTALQAALGLPQVARIEEIVRRKRELAAEYARRLGDVAGLELPAEQPWARSIFWMYAVVLADEVPFDAAELAARLERDGIETRPFFLGMHEQPAFHDRGLFGGESYPVAERLARRGLYLPSGLGLTADDLDRIAAAVARALA